MLCLVQILLEIWKQLISVQSALLNELVGFFILFIFFKLDF